MRKTQRSFARWYFQFNAFGCVLWARQFELRAALRRVCVHVGRPVCLAPNL